MNQLKSHASPRLLVFTGGHPFERGPFTALIDSLGLPWNHAEQPGAADLLSPEGTADADVVVFYDMPGIRFTRGDPPTEFLAPSLNMIEGLRTLCAQGKPMVFLHHAVAGWPAWEGYAEIIGARFHYQPATLRGVSYPDSGYRFDVTHHVEVLDHDHPICAGLGDGFDLTDELYLFPVLTDAVVPLLRTTFPMTDHTQFYSADLAIRGHRNSNEGWTHPAGRDLPGSDLVGWVKNAGASPVVYLQFGDGPVTYADPSFRQVLSNAVAWAASSDAATWARDRQRHGS
jgi:uncharacterized protein